MLVDRLEIVDAGDLVVIGIEGSHFLWKMVRRIVGVLVEIGRGGLDANAAATFLSVSSTAPARLTAPASGLFLETVRYAGEPRQAKWCVATPLTYSSRTPSTSRTTSP